MFYDRFLELCKSKGVKPTNACVEAGLSRGLAAKWKATGTERPSADVLEKMSDYFGVSIDEILEIKKVDPVSVDLSSDTESTFYDKYCELCRKSGLTPSGAASQIGFNRASVTVWKNSGNPPKPELLNKIADFFCVTTDYLLGNEIEDQNNSENFGSFYDIFLYECKKKGVRPSRAAEDCGINRSNVCNWKNNRYTPRGDALQKIANYFGVSTDYLLGGIPTEEPDNDDQELEEYIASISSNLKRIRESHGMSQAEFGKIAGVTDKAVSTWENGLKTPRLGAIQKIADYFYISKSEILGDNPDFLVNSSTSTISFYDRYTELCDQKGVSPSKAAIDAGISKSLVSKWKINGRMTPSYEVITKLSEYFGIPKSELLDDYPFAHGPVTEQFGIRLRSLREGLDLSQQEFANQIGVSKSSVNMYERGEREPGLETLVAIADFFNVDMDYLFGRTESRYRNDCLKVPEEGGYALFYERYIKLCQDANIAPSAAATQAGFNRGTVSIWKKKYESGQDVVPDQDVIDKICVFFGCSEQWLRGISETGGSSITNAGCSITDDDIRLINAYHAASSDVRDIIDLILAYHTAQENSIAIVDLALKLH